MFQQDIDYLKLDPTHPGGRIDCYDSRRFCQRTIDKQWTAFEGEPDLVFFPVSMTLDQHLTTKIKTLDGRAYTIWAPLDASPEIVGLSDFPTSLDLLDVKALLVGDGEDLANHYVKALSEDEWINIAGATMFIVTSPLSPRR